MEGVKIRKGNRASINTGGGTIGGINKVWEEELFSLLEGILPVCQHDNVLICRLTVDGLSLSPALHLSQWIPCLSIVIYPSSSSSLLLCVRLLAPHIPLRLESCVGVQILWRETPFLMSLHKNASRQPNSGMRRRFQHYLHSKWTTCTNDFM